VTSLAKLTKLWRGTLETVVAGVRRESHKHAIWHRTQRKRFALTALARSICTFMLCAKVFCTSAIQLQYKNFFLYCSCIALVRTAAMQRCHTSFLQLAENLQATCSSCKKNLYCSCIALVRTAAIQQKFFCYVFVVVLHLCGPLNSISVAQLFYIM